MSFKASSLILLLLILCSCKKEESTIFFEEISMSSKDTNLVFINIPKAIGNSEITENINTKLEERVHSYLNVNEVNNKDVKSIYENIDLFERDFKKFKIDFPESQQIWEAQIDGEVLHQTDNVISISITSYINTGGAHGNLHISLLNFNPLTGHLVPTEDIVSDLAKFKTIAKPFFKKAIEAKAVSNMNSFALPQNIGFNENGVILLYNTYEIAPYASGIIEFTIPCAEVEAALAFDCF